MKSYYLQRMCIVFCQTKKKGSQLSHICIKSKNSNKYLDQGRRGLEFSGCLSKSDKKYNNVLGGKQLRSTSFSFQLFV